MNTLQIKIHELFKNKFESASNQKMLCQKGLLSLKNKFIFEDLSQNLYEAMSEKVISQFKDAYGDKIFEKMHSLRSSSAMAYNIFGNENVIFKGFSALSKGEYKVTYEKALETFKGAKSKNHIDLLLENENENVFFEMKFFEPFYHKVSFNREISSICEFSDNYIYTDSAFPFMESIRRIKGAGLVRYDAYQMLMHALGIYNYVRQNEDALKGKKIKLINCIWTIENPFEEEKLKREFDNILFEENTDFAKFKECMFSVTNLFEKKGIDFDISLIEVKDLILDLEMPEAKRAWLKRYL